MYLIQRAACKAVIQAAHFAVGPADDNPFDFFKLAEAEMQDGRIEGHESAARLQFAALPTLRLVTVEDLDGDGSIDLVSIYRAGKLVRREILKPEVVPL